MHEVGIMRQAVEIALEAAGGEDARRITRISIEIGKLAGVVPAALEFAFEAATDATIAQGARLEWTEIPVQCACENRCAPFYPDGVIYKCPVCGVISKDILHGRELRVREIDVES